MRKVNKSNMLYDVFICHASEDKEGFVKPLAEELRKSHVEVWFDEFSLDVGDSLRESIDKGLAKSRYGIVVLSKHFFKKKWTQWELNGLVAREMSEDKKIILPIWHNITKKEILNVSPPLADIKALESAKGLQNVCRGLLKKIHPQESPLVVARDELIYFGIKPPVISDEWWLDVVESSNKLSPWGMGIPDQNVWDRWAFPLPNNKSHGKARGVRLAWTAMQMKWTNNADKNCICQLTRPEKVLDFINSQPGLKNVCFEFPEILAEYAPQLTIKGFGGEFEDYFEKMLLESMVEQNILRKKHSTAGSGITTNKLAPACSETIALRHPTFGDYESSIMACHFVQGDLGGSQVQFYKCFEYLIWFLSSGSKWLPTNTHKFLLDGMKKWGAWVTGIDSPNENNIFIHDMMGANNYGQFKVTAKDKQSLLDAIKKALDTLAIKDDPKIIMDRFMDEDIIQAYFRMQKRRGR